MEPFKPGDRIKVKDFQAIAPELHGATGEVKQVDYRRVYSVGVLLDGDNHLSAWRPEHLESEAGS